MDMNKVAVQAVMRQYVEKVEAGWRTPDVSTDSLALRERLRCDASVFYADKLMQAPQFADPHLQAPFHADGVRTTPLAHAQPDACVAYADKLISVAF